MRVSINSLSNPLIRNAISLYAIRIISLAIPLVSLPILTHRIQKADFGRIIFAQSLGSWLMIIIEFGSIYTATRQVAQSRSNYSEISDIVSAVQGSKLILTIIYFSVCVLIYFLMPQTHSEVTIVLIFLVSSAFQGLTPIWYFQGMEKIYIYSFIDLMGRMAIFLSTLLLVWKSGGGIVYALINLAVSAGIMTVSTFVMYKNHNFRRFDIYQSVKFLKLSVPMFLMRAGSSLYISAPIVLTGSLLTPQLVAVYGGAERLFRAAISFISPVADSLYPRVMSLATTDKVAYQKWLVKSFFILTSISLIIFLVIEVFSPIIIKLILGESYVGSVAILRILAIAIPGIGLGTFLGTTFLLSKNKDATFTVIVIFSGILNVALLYFFLPKLSTIGAAISVVVTEWVVVMLCILAIIMHTRGTRGDK